MQKISILGCGWLGLPLAKQLSKNYNISGSVRQLELLKTLEKENINPFFINLDDDLDIVTSFFNAETLIITIPASSEKYVQHHKKLISIVEKSSIKNVIYCSSISVYGNQTGVITEKTATNPASENGKKMVEMEQLLLKNTHFNTSILRLGGLIGKQRHPAKHLSGKILKHPQSLINLIHLIDSIGCIETLINNNLTGIFNGVTPYHPKKITYYSSICKQLHIPQPIIESDTCSQGKIIQSDKIQKHYTFINSTLSL